LERIDKAEAEGKIVEKKRQISFEEFGSLDLCIGEILEAGRIKGSEKLHGS